MGIMEFRNHKPLIFCEANLSRKSLNNLRLEYAGSLVANLGVPTGRLNLQAADFYDYDE